METSPMIGFSIMVYGSAAPTHFTVSRDSYIFQLHRTILDENRSLLMNVSLNTLAWYKLNKPVPLMPENTLAKRMHTYFQNVSKFAKPLKQRDVLSEILPPDTSVDYIYLMVIPPLPNAQPSAVDSTVATLHDQRLEYDRLRPKIAPSKLAMPLKFLFEQRRPSGPAFYFNRPPDAAASIPVTLLHPVLAQFVQDCTEHTPTEADNQLTLEMSYAMSDNYASQKERLARFREIMTENGLEMHARAIEGTEFVTEGDMRAGPFAYCILVGQNDAGAEPIFQAGAYYAEFMAGVSHKYPRARLPSLLLYLVGPHLGFVGAVFTDRPNMQVLVRPLPLFWHHTDSEMRTVAARYFGALKTAISSLQAYYSDLSTIESTGNPKFPHQHQYTSLADGSTCNFVYRCQVQDNLVFFGETVGGEKICIKFSQSYSQEVHAKCAEMGCAPRLRGFEKLPGSWFMVVMDDLSFSYNPFSRMDATPALRQNIHNSLEQLHRSGLVHGDVRDANILVHDDGARFMLLDFEWAGRIGEARYCMNLNRGRDLWRPDGARDGELVLPEHDMDMVKHMFKP